MTKSRFLLISLIFFVMCKERGDVTLSSTNYRINKTFSLDIEFPHNWTIIDSSFNSSTAQELISKIFSDSSNLNSAIVTNSYYRLNEILVTEYSIPSTNPDEILLSTAQKQIDSVKFYYHLLQNKSSHTTAGLCLVNTNHSSTEIRFSLAIQNFDISLSIGQSIIKSLKYKGATVFDE